MHTPHVVIIGAGFGGTYTARHLIPHIKKGELRVTLINRTNYFLFTPLLHEVATGSLTPTSVTESLGEIFANSGVKLIIGDATVNLEERSVKVNGTELSFDYLVITSGSETNYFNTPGAEQYALPLKTVGDAMHIRERVIRAFEEAHACKTDAERSKILSFVIVGAGPTGVELTAELAEFAGAIEKRYHHAKNDLSLHLVSSDSVILKMLPERLQKIALNYLKKRDVNILCNKTVTSVTETSVVFKDGGFIDAGMIIWAAGVTPVVPKAHTAVIPSERGRISIDEHLRVIGFENIFAIGDAANAHDGSTQNGPVPMLAQAATMEAHAVARNIVASINKQPLTAFHYRSKGVLVSLGEWAAIGTMGSLQITGPIAWFIWRTVYLFKFHSTRKRVRIAFEWTVNLFTPRDTTTIK